MSEVERGVKDINSVSKETVCQRCSYTPSFQETSSQSAASLWEIK